MGLYDKKDDLFGDAFAKLLNPSLYKALENYTKAVENANKELGVVEATCPSCGIKHKISLYNETSKSLDTNGVLYCHNCRAWIEYRIVRLANGNQQLLLRKFDSCEKTDIDDKMINYLADNVSVEDWKIIINNSDLTNDKYELFRIIKSILESRGVVFNEPESNE